MIRRRRKKENKKERKNEKRKGNDNGNGMERRDFCTSMRTDANIRSAATPGYLNHGERR